MKRAAKAPAGWAARVGRWLVRGAVFVCVVPALQCLLLDFHDPWFTWTMVAAMYDHWRETGRIERPTYHPVRLADLPADVPIAAISSEDDHFFQHHGFDFSAIGDAAMHYGEPGLRGGSTISQQVAKNVFLWQERSWTRKALEAWYTVWLELLVPKRRILEVYLNVAETGPMTFGIDAGAERWFGKPAPRLTAYEAAVLVSLLPAPDKWTPRTPYVRHHASLLVAHPVDVPELR